MRCFARIRCPRFHNQVDLARRQYDAVDPANRLVARGLERRWEKALEDLEAVRLEAEVRAAAR